MISNNNFINAVKESFGIYLNVGTSRSPAKLKPLHGMIAKNIKETLGENYSVISQGFGNGKEELINGRYYPKKADITVKYKGKTAGGYAVKFVMQNYSQNSVNYFENMLGETANIRSNGFPYFQIFITFDKVPHYKKNGVFQKFDIISANNLKKYIKLSEDNTDIYNHTPDKTLISVIKLKDIEPDFHIRSAADYRIYYKSVIGSENLMRYHEIEDNFADNIILNNYKDFIERSCHIILGKQKD